MELVVGLREQQLENLAGKVAKGSEKGAERAKRGLITGAFALGSSPQKKRKKGEGGRFGWHSRR